MWVEKRIVVVRDRRWISRRISTNLGGVEADGRLVEDEQLWTVEDGLGQTDALTVAFAQFADGTVEVVDQVGGVDCVRR